MHQVEPRATEPSANNNLATLEAMAGLASQTGSVVHVVVPRERGVVESARWLAYQAGVAVCVDLMPHTVRLRFDGQL
ncbi:MAG: hypothetical protein LC797_14485 [Chloroflexi bacterium]|nr:hypothetical protein [Chloroflexota bacterium]